LVFEHCRRDNSEFVKRYIACQFGMTIAIGTEIAFLLIQPAVGLEFDAAEK